MNIVPAERVAVQNPNARFPDRDIATINDNGGVRFLFDLSFGFCYPGGPLSGRPAPTDPAHGDPIYNMTRQGEGDGNGEVSIFSDFGGALTYQGGGFDLSESRSLHSNPSASGVLGPAAALADIWNPAPSGAAVPGQAQHFLIVGYFKLPMTGDWGTTGSIQTLFSAANTSSAYVNGTDIVQMAMRLGAPYQVDARRQIDAGEIEDTMILQPRPDDYGNVVQLAYWRNSAGSVFRLRSAAGAAMSSPTVYGDNTQNFSDLRPCWGHPIPWEITSDGYLGARVYRGWIENLARSGRDPISVLDADWTDIVRRGQFS